MIINHNITALNTHRQMASATSAQASSMEKLSSGMRINSAKDDAAGLSISEKMRGQIRGLEQASRNSQDAISLMQTAEGGLNETHDILQRMRELAVQSANDTNEGVDREAIQEELNQLRTEIDRVANQTEFNEKKLLSGNIGGAVDQDVATTTVLGVIGVAAAETSGAKADTYTITSGATGELTMTNSALDKSQTITNADGAQELNFSDFGVSIKTNAGYTADAAIGNVEITTGSATFQIGANKDQNIDLSIRDMSASGTVLNLSTVDVSTKAGANTAIESISNAIAEVSKERSKIGATQNRLEHTINNLNTSAENLTSAESRIRDVDYAEAA